jgi:hypothetical protein
MHGATTNIIDAQQAKLLNTYKNTTRTNVGSLKKVHMD